MVTAAMKLKDACTLEESYDQPRQDTKTQKHYFASIRVFSNQSVLHITWPKYWSLSFNINPSNEYSGLIAFRMDWLDLLAVEGTLNSLL